MEDREALVAWTATIPPVLQEANGNILSFPGSSVALLAKAGVSTNEMLIGGWAAFSGGPGTVGSGGVGGWSSPYTGGNVQNGQVIVYW
jgi:hypothetical protein